jgi:hypothetical protein
VEIAKSVADRRHGTRAKSTLYNIIWLSISTTRLPEQQPQ